MRYIPSRTEWAWDYDDNSASAVDYDVGDGFGTEA